MYKELYCVIKNIWRSFLLHTRERGMTFLHEKNDFAEVSKI